MKRSDGILWHRGQRDAHLQKARYFRGQWDIADRNVLDGPELDRLAFKVEQNARQARYHNHMALMIQRLKEQR